MDCPVCKKEADRNGCCQNSLCTLYEVLVCEPDNTVVCPECEGGCFTMECYGGQPTEVKCERCYGEGRVENDEDDDESSD